MKIPSNLKNIDLNRHMRRNKMFDKVTIQKNVYEAALGLAKEVIESRKKDVSAKTVEPARYHSFTNDRADQYWAKQIKIAEVVEQRFAAKVDAFLKHIEDTAVRNLPSSTKALKTKAEELVDWDSEVEAAIDLFTPLQEELAELSGSEAYQELQLSTLYTPTQTLRDYIKQNVAKFASSFVETDRERLVSILEDGLRDGQSIPQIERRIRSEFGEYRKLQSTRIARSETIRASNWGALDAFKVSGVVQGKQWYTSHDARVCKICGPLDGKILHLDASFPYEDNYDSKLAPPAHVACRCVVLPVLAEAKSMESVQSELEKTKAYASELERLIGIKNE